MFKSRKDAGRMLATRLRRRQYEDPVVLALSRSGVPVASEIALALNAPLDISSCASSAGGTTTASWLRRRTTRHLRVATAYWV